MPYLFLKKLQKSGLMRWNFSNCSNFNILLWFLIDDDAFVSAATANACSMVHLICLFMKTHLLASLQDNCLDLVRCAFLRKLSAYVRNITAFCQYLLMLIISTDLADRSAKPKYLPGWYIGLSLVGNHFTSECKSHIHGVKNSNKKLLALNTEFLIWSSWSNQHSQ